MKGKEKPFGEYWKMAALWLFIGFLWAGWGLSGCPAVVPGEKAADASEVSQEVGFIDTKEKPKPEPVRAEPSKDEVGVAKETKEENTPDTQEPKKEPWVDGGVDKSPDMDAGVDSISDSQDGGQDAGNGEVSIPEEVKEWPYRDDICGGKRPCVTTYAGHPWDKEGPALTDWLTAPSVVISNGKDLLYLFDYSRHHIYQYNTTTKRVKIAAGNGNVGEKDGPALQIPLAGACGMAVNPKGELYFAAVTNIRKLNNQGNIITLKKGFSYACGLAFDKNGLLYIADEDKIHTYDETNGKLTTFAGTGVKGHKNGPRLQAQFNLPYNLVFDSKGSLFVSEDHNGLIRKIDNNGNVTTFYGTVPSRLITKHDFTGMVIDSQDNLYLTRQKNHSIIKIAPNGTKTDVTGGFNGYTDGPFNKAEFWGPTGLTFDTQGRLYVSDELNKRLRMLDLSTKTVSTVIGTDISGKKDGPADWAIFDNPRSIALSPQGTLYISDFDNDVIRKVDNNRIVSTVGCRWARRYASDGKGNLYSSGGYVVVRYSLQPTCSSKIIAGKSTPGHQDGPINQATFSSTRGMTFDSNNNMYVADRDRIRYIDFTKQQVSTFGRSTYSKSFFQGVARNAKGELFATDSGLGIIVKFSSKGVFSIFAGEPGIHDYVDAKGRQARFQYPRDIAMDKAGNLYVIDNGVHTIRKIDPQGNVTTFAGKQKNGFANGWGLQALFHLPSHLLFDGKDALYVSDEQNHRIRKILLK